MVDTCVIFVLPKNCHDKDDCSITMKQAAEASVKNKVNTKWTNENNLDINNLKKTDYVVFEKFNGEIFNSIKSSKSATVIGPWCLLICLMEGKCIPRFDWPIYNVAMYDCVVTCSALPKNIKLEIKEKVELMGGIFSAQLYEKSTHLITKSVKSEKYSAASSMGIKIMLPTWIEAVWAASQESNVHSDNREFEKYKCPPFHMLNISSTGISNIRDRHELESLIVQNGGKFSGQLNLKTTDVLVCPEKVNNYSEKFKAVQKSPTIQCVTINWVKESASKGYCLPFTNFTVNRQTSTPKKGDNLNPDFSMISAVNASRASSGSIVNETNVSQMNHQTKMESMLNKSALEDAANAEDVSVLNKLDVKKAKQAGPFLDGCCLYLVGFTGEIREKICKMINVSGATRCDDMSDRVTHVVSSSSSSYEEKLIRSKNYSCAFVSLQWLVDSMENGQPVNEEKYAKTSNCDDSIKLASPLGKKGLHLLRSNSTITERDFNLSQQKSEEQLPPPLNVEEEKRIMERYMMAESKSAQQTEEDTMDQLMKKAACAFDSQAFNNATNSNARCSSSSSFTQESTETINLFKEMSFYLKGFDADQYATVKEKIESARGFLTSDSNMASFVVLPVFIKSENEFELTETINDIWIHQCIFEDEIICLKYYHRPILIKNVTVLDGCVVTISGFGSFERKFLKALIEELGGVPQDSFNRISNAAKGIVGSTHLVTEEPDGKKYQAALQWGKPVMHKMWLIRCALTGERPSEAEYAFDTANFSESSMLSYMASVVKDNEKTLKNSDVSIEKTPLRSTVSQGSSGSCSTPRRKSDCEDVCSQYTPVNKIMMKFRCTNLLGSPFSPPVPKRLDDIKTPDTPYENLVSRDNPSKELRKNILRLINTIPDYVPPKRRKSTPLKELTRRLWDQIKKNNEDYQANLGKCLDFDGENVENKEADTLVGNDDGFLKNDEPRTPKFQENTQPTVITNKLQQLESVLSSGNSNSSRRKSKCFQLDSDPATDIVVPNTQPFTVQWDMEYKDSEELHQQSRIFMISGLSMEDKQSLGEHLKSLGGVVSETSSYDHSATHLICAKPAKNEKTMAMMAAGKWILHTNYVEASIKANKFLNEEDYEFGNPKSMGNIYIEIDKDLQDRMHSIYYWRKEVAHGNKPFASMRAIIVAEKKSAFENIIKAGGGSVVDISAPFPEYVNATHCLIEPKQLADSFSSYIPLCTQGIYCVSTLYVSDYLHRNDGDIMNFIIPQFLKYYKR